MPISSDKDMRESRKDIYTCNVFETVTESLCPQQMKVCLGIFTKLDWFALRGITV